METSLTLLERLAASSADDAWRRLCALYEPLLGDWLARAGVPAGDRDDLTQEVLMVVVREVAAFERRGPGAFRGWLRGILARRVLNYFRGRAGRANAVGGSDVLERLHELGERESALSRLWDREHDEYVAARALRLVRGDFARATWEAFRRQVLDGRPAAAVAAELGLSVNAVLVAKSRVLKRVRAELRGVVT